MKNAKQLKKQFFQSLQCGTGGAYLIQKENPKINFSKYIIKGAIKNYAYDRQSEGSRAKYIFSLIKAAPQRTQIENQIIQYFKKDIEDDYDLYQILELMICFYKNGNKKARKALMDGFKKQANHKNWFRGEDLIMKMEGVKGVLIVAKKIGKHLMKNKDVIEDSWQIDQFQKKNKNIDIYKILKKEARKNKYIKAYYNSILKNKANYKVRREPRKIDFKWVKERIVSGKFFYITKEKAKDLSKTEVKKLAEEFLSASKNKEKELYLIFFTQRKFPSSYQSILKIAKRKKSKNNSLVEYAVEALQYFKSKELRKFAIKKIKATKNPSTYLPLLVSNYRKGDYKLLNEVIDRSNNKDFIHSLIYGLIDIYKTNPIKECQQPMEKMYLKMNCGIHREDVINVLYKNNVLTDTILSEMKYDSDSGVRGFCKKIKKEQK